MPDYLEAAGEIIEHLGDVLAQRSHVAAALAAAAGAVLFRFVHDLGARQMVGQGLPLWPGAIGHRQRSALGDGLADRLGLSGFQLLQPQLELFDASADAL